MTSDYRISAILDEGQASSIHQEHITVFHKAPHDALLGWWQQNGAGLDLKDHMNFDPYLGRVTENSLAQQQQNEQANTENA